MSEQAQAPGEAVAEVLDGPEGANARLKQNLDASLRSIHHDLVNTLNRHPEFHHLGPGRVFWGYLDACEKEFALHPYGPGLSNIHYLSVLIEALDSPFPAEAIAVVPRADPHQLWQRVVFADLLYGEWGYWRVYPELADLIEQFIHHLEAHRDHLIEWGDYPESFTLAPTLDDMLGKLYPFARPPWPARPSSPSAARRHSLVGTQVQLYGLRGCCPREYIGCDCPPGPLAHELSDDDRDRIKAGRKRFLDIKVRALGKVCEWLRREEGDPLWALVLPVLTEPKEGLLEEDITFYLRVDQAFKNRNFQNWGVFDLGLPYKCPGGLTALLQMVMHWEMERLLGINAARFEELGAFAPSRIDAPEPRPRSYFDLFHTPGLFALDVCMERNKVDCDNAKAFHAAFVRQVNDDLATAFRGRTSPHTNGRQEDKDRLFGSYAAALTHVARDVARDLVEGRDVPVEVLKGMALAMVRNERVPTEARARLALTLVQHVGVPTEVPEGAAPAPPAPVQAPKQAARAETPVRFPLVSGLRWGNVTIAFLSNEKMQVKARGIHRIFTFEQLGLKDGRNDEPTQRWKLLMDLAKCHDEITRSDAENLKYGPKAFSDLRKFLKYLMQIEDDPFYPYSKEHGYSAKFQLVPPPDDGR